MKDRIEFIQKYNKPVLFAQKNLAGFWYIGYNYTINVYNGSTCTLEQANKLLFKQVQVINNQLVNLFGVSYPKLKKKQLIALTSLIFTIGIDKFVQSNIPRLVKEGELVEARKQFAKYAELGILSRRIKEEIELF